MRISSSPPNPIDHQRDFNFTYQVSNTQNIQLKISLIKKALFIADSQIKFILL